MFFSYFLFSSNGSLNLVECASFLNMVAKRSKRVGSEDRSFSNIGPDGGPSLLNPPFLSTKGRGLNW